MTKRPLVVFVQRKQSKKAIRALKASGCSGCKINRVCVHVWLFGECTPNLYILATGVSFMLRQCSRSGSSSSRQQTHNVGVRGKWRRQARDAAEEGCQVLALQTWPQGPILSRLGEGCCKWDLTHLTGMMVEQKRILIKSIWKPLWVSRRQSSFCLQTK